MHTYVTLEPQVYIKSRCCVSEEIVVHFDNVLGGMKIRKYCVCGVKDVVDVLINIPMALVAGFLLHNVVAAYYTVPVALGSSNTHRELGAVWAICGVVWYIFATFFARETKVEIIRNDAKIIRFVVPSQEIANYIVKRAKMSPPSIPRLNTYSPKVQVLPMLTLLIVLVLHGIVLFGVLVKKCSDCGGCDDDGPPDAGCYYDNEPGRILGSITLFICISLVVVRLALRYSN